MEFEAVRTLCGRKRTLEILATIDEEGPLNYTDIEQTVDTSSDVVSTSLDLLEEYDLIERMEHSKKDVQYATTADGVDVLATVERLERTLTDGDEVT